MKSMKNPSVNLVFTFILVIILCVTIFVSARLTNQQEQYITRLEDSLNQAVVIVSQQKDIVAQQKEKLDTLEGDINKLRDEYETAYATLKAKEKLKNDLLWQSNQDVKRLTEQLDSLKRENATIKATSTLSHTPKVSRGGLDRSLRTPSLVATATNSEWIDFKVTHYNLKGNTRTGRPVSDSTIAVDPSIIPLDSIVEIMFSDGTVVQKRAEDTGSAIKGHKIDFWLDASSSDTMKAGVTTCKLRIIQMGDNSKYNIK